MGNHGHLPAQLELTNSSSNMKLHIIIFVTLVCVALSTKARQVDTEFGMEMNRGSCAPKMEDAKAKIGLRNAAMINTNVETQIQIANFFVDMVVIDASPNLGLVKKSNTKFGPTLYN